MQLKTSRVQLRVKNVEWCGQQWIISNWNRLAFGVIYFASYFAITMNLNLRLRSAEIFGKGNGTVTFDLFHLVCVIILFFYGKQCTRSVYCCNGNDSSVSGWGCQSNSCSFDSTGPAVKIDRENTMKRKYTKNRKNDNNITRDQNTNASTRSTAEKMGTFQIYIVHWKRIRAMYEIWTKSEDKIIQTRVYTWIYHHTSLWRKR